MNGQPIPRMLMTVLETIASLPKHSRFEYILCEASGYSHPYVWRAMKILREAGWVVYYRTGKGNANKNVSPAIMELTERGKIALAIWHGQQQKKRHNKKQAA